MDMFYKRSMKIITTLILAMGATMLFGVTALAQGPGTAFSYQGNLSDGSNPVSDNCALEFKLYDAESGGTQIGNRQNATNVTVSEGLFVVDLDFGSGSFSGPGRYLEVAAQCSGDTSLTTLSPRRPLHPTPCSVYATQAGSVAWSDVSGKPTGLATITDTISSLTCADGEVAKWNSAILFPRQMAAAPR